MFNVGERNIQFFIVKSGEMEIVDCSGDEPKTIATHHEGQFTGDISHLTGMPAVVSAIARGECEVYEISGDALRNALNQCPVISDIILQAFIARRQFIRESPDFIGPARDRIALLRRHLPRARFSVQESRALHLGGSWKPIRMSTSCSSSLG